MLNTVKYDVNDNRYLSVTIQKWRSPAGSSVSYNEYANLNKKSKVLKEWGGSESS